MFRKRTKNDSTIPGMLYTEIQKGCHLSQYSIEQRMIHGRSIAFIACHEQNDRGNTDCIALNT